ncbi:cold shock protein 2-like [Setaria italica]|uniref:cold shock protein 2-like n=1 Tax=Setaria italica TaxID=4555 RepID=UPI000BE4BBED|nr:cold shock protein 2-like [Setaria italica]
MDGHGDDGLQDLFPEGDPAFPAPAFDLLSQAESSGVPREGLQALDLNSQAEDWGDYSSYSDLLRGEGAPRGRGSRSLGLRAARSGGRGGGSGSRAGAGGSRGGGGGSRAGGGGSRAGAGGSRAGGGGASVTRPLFEPSLADGAGGSGGRSGGRGGGRARRSRGRGGRSTADYIEPYDVENWVDVDDEDGAPQNVESIFPTSKINRFDKAQWTEHNTGVLCDLWVEQIRSGNCPKGSITSRGLRIVADKYQMATGLKHQHSQIRNRINQLKTLHTFWKACNKMVAPLLTS